MNVYADILNTVPKKLEDAYNVNIEGKKYKIHSVN